MKETGVMEVLIMDDFAIVRNRLTAISVSSLSLHGETAPSCLCSNYSTASNR